MTTNEGPILYLHPIFKAEPNLTTNPRTLPGLYIADAAHMIRKPGTMFSMWTLPSSLVSRWLQLVLPPSSGGVASYRSA